MVSWSSKKHKAMSRSTMEAEYRSLAEEAAKVTWVADGLIKLLSKSSFEGFRERVNVRAFEEERGKWGCADWRPSKEANWSDLSFSINEFILNPKTWATPKLAAPNSTRGTWVPQDVDVLKFYTDGTVSGNFNPAGTGDFRLLVESGKSVMASCGDPSIGPGEKEMNGNSSVRKALMRAIRPLTWVSW
ncbi:hypothetical protein F3Y22_tig00110988pilonHSYRG00191 [Hibiscus syriacus]|uniref:Uncharacterized protein n=1 Tax=Hibiscus syriacus TaxID=106335 RepID=A0A6A2Z9I3_HIBSY|nr:hypothetical protein F3Y22_tig00110988pilonHSYRG00191 [Hibiscus syriacus]